MEIQASCFEATFAFTVVTAPVTRNLPEGDLVDGLQDFDTLVSRHPAILPSELQGSDSYPGRSVSC